MQHCFLVQIWCSMPRRGGNLLKWPFSARLLLDPLMPMPRPLLWLLLPQVLLLQPPWITGKWGWGHFLRGRGHLFRPRLQEEESNGCCGSNEPGLGWPRSLLSGKLSKCLFSSWHSGTRRRGGERLWGCSFMARLLLLTCLPSSNRPFKPSKIGRGQRAWVKMPCKNM